MIVHCARATTRHVPPPGSSRWSSDCSWCAPWTNNAGVGGSVIAPPGRARRWRTARPVTCSAQSCFHRGKPGGGQTIRWRVQHQNAQSRSDKDFPLLARRAGVAYTARECGRARIMRRQGTRAYSRRVRRCGKVAGALDKGSAAPSKGSPTRVLLSLARIFCT